MKYYPIFLNIKNKECLLIGGGNIGYRKAKNLLKYDVKLTVISDKICDKFDKLKKNKLTFIKRKFEEKDIIKKYFLIFSAISNKSVNNKIYDLANKLNIPVNISDSLDNCSFIMPAIVNRDPLQIAISTSGTSPLFAKEIKNELFNIYGKEYSYFLKYMNKFRKKIIENYNNKDRIKIFKNMINSDSLNLLKNNKINKSLLKDVYNLLMEIANGKS